MEKIPTGFEASERHHIVLPLFSCMHHSDPKLTLLRSFVVHYTLPSLFETLPVVYKVLQTKKPL